MSEGGAFRNIKQLLLVRMASATATAGPSVGQRRSAAPATFSPSAPASNTSHGRERSAAASSPKTYRVCIQSNRRTALSVIPTAKRDDRHHIKQKAARMDRRLRLHFLIGTDLRVGSRFRCVHWSGTASGVIFTGKHCTPNRKMSGSTVMNGKPRRKSHNLGRSRRSKVGRTNRIVFRASTAAAIDGWCHHWQTTANGCKFLKRSGILFFVARAFYVSVPREFNFRSPRSKEPMGPFTAASKSCWRFAISSQ
jgi:hypothetical protein